MNYRINELAKYLADDIMTTDKGIEECLNLYRDANSWDGSFEWVDTWYLPDLLECQDWSYRNRKQNLILINDIINAELSSAECTVRYTNFGELEEVTDYDLASDAEIHAKELAEDILIWWERGGNMFNTMPEDIEKWLTSNVKKD